MRARLAVLVVLAVAGLIEALCVTAISVSGAGHEAEVRITAQRLDDGRMEFALQQREADGGWSDRLLPRSRFFPATATVGRWLSSTPLTVRGPGGGDDAEGTEVRITAQRLADGRTEFALQERDVDGGWSERLLPRGRFSPATVTVGRWLSSTPLAVSLPEVLPHTAEEGGSVASDRAALVALYNATGGASWITNTNWLSDRPIGEWHGVTTYSDGRVAELWLWGNKLRGSIPAELDDLTELQTLDLRSNQLTGPIPAWLGDLTNLRRLYLGSNRLTGPIPAGLVDLTNLESLRLSDNQLTGCVPVGLRGVASNDLGELALPDCGEVSPDTAEDGGSVASDRAALVALYNATGGASWVTSTKWLTDRPLNEWHGVTTNSDGRVAELKLFTNQLTGPIPAELGELTDLRWLSFSFNQLRGPIPAELGGLTNLEALYLGGNQLTRPIPAELGNLANLRELSLFNNELTGLIPAELGDLANLQQMNLANNQLTGPIPAELGALTNLELLGLAFNELTGPIPAGLGALTSLESLWLASNQLTGPTLAELGALTNLEYLSLANNELTGPIPAELGALTNLESLWLSNNQLTGPIPAWLGDLTNLEYLGLSNNGLTGPIPAGLGALSNLESLGLSSNQLTGPIPAELGDLTNLVRLWLAGNGLTGPIPAWLGDLTDLKFLLLDSNQLTGPIPTELGTLTNLETLSLSHNELTGCVPAGLRDVASNDLGELDLPDCGEVSPNAADDGGSVASDRAALGALYIATGGASWITSTNWLSDRPLDEWHGLTTNSDGRVAGLVLDNNRLTGPIPAELGDLTILQTLDVRFNQLRGSIPAELSSLTNLEYLSLLNNQLTGPIPAELGALTMLESLFLSGNELTGCVLAGWRDVATNDLANLGLPDCG